MDDIEAAFTYVKSAAPKADGCTEAGARWWYVYALIGAYLAGVKAEREACKKLAKNWEPDDAESRSLALPEGVTIAVDIASGIAAAIDARGKDSPHGPTT